MIHEVSGDLLLTGATAIAHSVAPNDSFHTGLALQLRERFPSMYKDFRHYCQTTHPKPGGIWAWSGAGPIGTIRIVALLTQPGVYDHHQKPGHAHLPEVSHALRALRTWVDQEQPASLALPRLATGVGGLDWKAVHPLIDQHLGSLAIPVYLYSAYRKGVQAREPVLTG